MLKFDIITIFPNIFNSYLEESFIKKACQKKIIEINVHDLRKWAKKDYEKKDNISAHNISQKEKFGARVDDRPFGGGSGMVIKIEPIFRAIIDLKKNQDRLKKSKIILFTPRGKKFNQKTAYDLSKLDNIIMICGRYEGVDERVAKNIADIELSIGDYDLMGGELPAMVVVETVTRLIPGTLGKDNFLKERITKEKGFIEYPQYTRPEVFEAEKYIKKWKNCPVKFSRSKKWRVPKVLLSGNHKKIEEWRNKKQKTIGKD